MFFNYFSQVALDLYFFIENSKIENLWKSSEITKITNSKNKIQKIKISEIKIGDLILLKNSEISAADLLVVASSTIRHGESIFHTNERRIDGQNVFYTKRAVKNMMGSTGSRSIRASKCVEKLTKLLSGHVEYDPPNDLIKFNGIFKLNNDPKVIMFSSKNVLFAGTKLCSSWAIGMVIYTGNNTKIMQKYKNFLEGNQRFYYKQNSADRIYNNCTKSIIFISFVECIISIIMLIGNSSALGSITVINKFQNSMIYKNFVALFLSFCIPIPVFILFMVDLISFYNAYKIQKIFNNDSKEETPEKKLFKRKEGFKKSNGSSDLGRIKENEAKGGFSSALDKMKQPLKGKGKDDSQSILKMSANGAKKSFRKTVMNTPKMPRRSATLQVHQNPFKKFAKRYIDDNLVRITDFRVLSNLGNIDHVVFDKTDTLTKTSIEIKSISTCSKNYNINIEEVQNLYKDVQKNPEKYNTRDDFEDQIKLHALSNYSEKSQEFGLELKGEFIDEVFDEDKQFLDKIKPKIGSSMAKIRADVNNFSKNAKSTRFLTVKKNNIYQSSPPAPYKYGSNDFNFAQSPKKRPADSTTLNLAKLEREVLLKFQQKKLGMIGKSRRNVRTNSRAPSLLLNHLGSMNSIELSDGEVDHLEGYTPSKKHKMSDFLVGFCYKKKEISNLVRALSLCHEARIVEGSKVPKSFNNEEKSTLGFCKKLGISIEGVNIMGQTKEDLNCVYKIKEDNKKGVIYKVLGINSFSKKRGRMSVLVQRLEEEHCTLYVKGNDDSMRDIIKFSENDKITFKHMIMNYRANGLKSIVIAKKVLKKTDYQAFLINYRLVSKMTRNQQENFEKLALGIEKDLEFLGCLGIKNNTNAGVETLVENMKKAEMKISVLTGDNIENSLMIVQQLKLATNNFNDASSFYSLRFNSHKKAISKIKRIVENLYQKLKIIKINKKVKSTDKDKKTIMSSEYRRLQFSRKKMTTASQIIVEKKLKEKNWNKEKEELFKPLLINGLSIDIIMSSEYLKHHFKFILYFCKNIIGYSLESKHKKFVVKCLKDTSMGLVMAVGDGFNDMAMMNESDVGVQLAHKDVPLIFGDVVINDLSILNYLIFVRGKRLFSNIISSQLLVVSFVPMVTIYSFLHDSVSCFSAEAPGLGIKMFMVFILLPVFVSAFTSNKTFTDSLLAKIPELYLEKRSLNYNYLPATILAIIVGIFDSIIIFSSAYFNMRYYVSPDGYRSYKELIAVFTLLNFLVIGIAKIYFLTIRRANCGFIYGSVATILLFVYLIANQPAEDNFTTGFPVVKVLQMSEFYFSLCHSIGSSMLFNYVFSLFVNRNFLHPLYFESLNQLAYKNLKFFRKEGMIQPKYFIPRERKTNISNFIRKIFEGEGHLMDGFLKKILTLDTNSFSFGLDWITNRIKDSAEHKRFKIFRRVFEYKSYRNFIAMLLVIEFLDFFFILASTDSSMGFLDVENLYIFAYFLLPFSASMIKKERKRVSLYIKISVCFSLATLFYCKFLLKTNQFKPTFFILSRFLQGPAQVEFTFGSLGIIGGLVMEMARWITQESFNGIEMNLSFRIKMVVDLLIICIASIIFKQKIDRMVKLDFLARLRIKNEVISSNERLRMLMPHFVLRKMKNFEMSQNFLADDAGEVTILFCDICQFNDVMKDCSENVIQIIDDVFRYFDYLCKQNGIQKIETVGKTYMACGGLKFIEENLDDELKKSSPSKRVLDLALGMMGYIDKFTYDAGKKLELKIGIHYGNCSYGVLGYHKPQFSLIGDTVNTTSRHCTTGPDSRIILSIEAYDALCKMSENIDYKFVTKMVKMKGKGMKKTYIVIRTIDQQRMKRRISIRAEVLENIRMNGKKQSRFKSQFSLEELDAQNIRKILDNEDEEEQRLIKVSIDEREMREETLEQSVEDFEQSLALYNDLNQLMQDDDNSISIEEKRKGGPFSNSKEKSNDKLRKSGALAVTMNPKQNDKNIVINLMNPFGESMSTFEKYFLKQMVLKNSTKIALCVYLLLIEKTANITQSMLKNDESSLFWTSGVIQTFICGLILIFIIFSRTLTAIREPFYSKLFLGIIFLFISSTRLLSSLIKSLQGASHNIPQMREEQNYDLVYMFMLETTLVNISGLFYFKDVLVYNAVSGLLTIALLISFSTVTTPHRVFTIIEVIAFNLTDAYFSFTTELNGINNLVYLEKKGLQLSQFVNRLLPKHIHERINKPKKKIGDFYENVTLLYADIVGFTSYSNKHSSRQVVAMLSSLFTDFDKECNRLGLFKIYTIGDCYVVMSFLDKNNRRNPKEEANAVTQMGIRMINIINDVRKRLKIDLNMRIGIHTGDVYGGVIGTDLVRFDLYGADVVIANKMESKGTAGRINVSESTKILLESLETSNYSFEFNKQVVLESLDTAVSCYFLNYEYNLEEKIQE